MNRSTRNFTAVATAVVALAIGTSGLASPAGASVGSGTGAAGGGAKHPVAQCKGANIKPTVHNEAVRREATLSKLVAKLQARKDPFGLNAAQIQALQAANSGVTALDAQIASTCYPTAEALRADASKLFVDYRVYWLRVPQTHVIEAADHLAEARARLGAGATKLAALVGSNASAQADLATMNAALAEADAKLGVAPNAGSSIAAVAGLQPAADMAPGASALETAHADLVATRAALARALAAGTKVVTDLQH